MVENGLDAAANSNVKYIRWQFFKGWLYEFENPKHTQTRRGTTTSYRPRRSRFEAVKRQLVAGQMAQGTAAAWRITAVLFVDAGTNFTA